MRYRIALVLPICFIALSAHAQISSAGSSASVAVAPTVSDRIGPQHALDNVGSVAGVVTAIDGSPLHDCRIELQDAGRGGVLATASTGLSGAFEFRNVPAGRYEIVATSGLEQTHENVQVQYSQATVELRLNVQNPDAMSGAPTVSVSELKIPEKARGEWVKGEQALGKNKLQDARKHADRALAIAPQFAKALTLRGIIKLGADDTQGGIADLQQSIHSDPNYALGYIALGAGLNAQRNFKEAQRTLERGMSLDPNAWQGWFELTKTEIALGNFKDALKDITRAQELNKDYPSIHLLMGHALLGNRQYARAVEEFELFLSQEPNSPHATNARAGLNVARSYMQSAGQ
ncbi:MAG TPA: tetratricopeptide repeat protein [candidate division Zixibacteria bacterium]|nr:tetratricopeptide repeat protein [candidate division Zixibacteria bacterium]